MHVACECIRRWQMASILTEDASVAGRGGKGELTFTRTQCETRCDLEGVDVRWWAGIRRRHRPVIEDVGVIADELVGNTKPQSCFN